MIISLRFLSLCLCREELQSMCSSGDSSRYFNSIGIPYFFAAVLPTSGTSRYIGNYGNADPLDDSQWSSLAYSTTSPTRQWSSVSSTCSGLVTTLQYEFLVAKSGERANPQNKIVSSSVSLVASDWTSRSVDFLPYFV